MSLSQAQRDAIDERPTRRAGGVVIGIKARPRRSSATERRAAWVRLQGLFIEIEDQLFEREEKT